MYFLSATKTLQNFSLILGLIPFKFCQKTKKFVLISYLRVSITKFIIFIILFYAVHILTRLFTSKTETPMDLIINVIRVMTVAVVVIYDIIQLFEINLRKTLYCEVMNEIIDLTELMIFKNLTLIDAAEKLKMRSFKIILIIFISGAGLLYFSVSISNEKGLFVHLLNYIYFNSHILMIVINSMYLIQIFMTLKCALDYLSENVKYKGKRWKKEKLVEIHSRVRKIIKKLVKIHGMQIIASLLAVLVFTSTSAYLAYALWNDSQKFHLYGVYILATNSPLFIIFYFTSKLSEVQNAVRFKCLKNFYSIKFFNSQNSTFLRIISTEITFLTKFNEKQAKYVKEFIYLFISYLTSKSI